jgi:hypothetical protein
MIREYERKTLSGIPVLVLAVLVGGGVVASFVAMARSGGELGWLWLALGLLVIAVLLVLGLFMIEPNQARCSHMRPASRLHTSICRPRPARYCCSGRCRQP